MILLQGVYCSWSEDLLFIDEVLCSFVDLLLLIGNFVAGGLFFPGDSFVAERLYCS